jgi:hypothetical protein
MKREFIIYFKSDNIMKVKLCLTGLTIRSPEYMNVRLKGTAGCRDIKKGRYKKQRPLKIQKQYCSYSGQIAETGQASAQVPQLVQMVASMV